MSRKLEKKVQNNEDKVEFHIKTSQIILRFYRAERILYQKNIPLLPFLIKGLIRILFYAVIPYEAEIENNVRFNYNGLGIVINRGCKIGNNTIICQNVTIGGLKNMKKECQYYPPQIGNHVFIGAGAVILGGVKIGDYAVIGANSVVKCDIPPHRTAVGAPARILDE